jgi:hypothetical protein
MINLFRVKGAQVIDDARVACERGENIQGMQKIDSFINPS